MKLKDFAANNNLSYSQAWRQYNSGKLQGYKDENGIIQVGDKPNEVDNTPNISSVVLYKTPDLPENIGVYEERAADTRSNKAATIRPTERYKHIDEGFYGFRSGTSNGYDDSDISIQDIVVLCQKCYNNFSVFRSTIDLMSEFCVGDIFFKGGSSKNRAFFESFFSIKKINLWDIQDQFYRELFRSSNVFFHRIEGKATQEDIKQLTQTFGASAKSVNLPIRYILLNPANIHAQGNISFANTQYYMVLTDYELERLRNPRTDEDKQVLENLDPKVRQSIKEKKQGIVRIPLDNKNIIAVFFKKQSYEPFSTPLGLPILADINFKREMRLLDQALLRTINQAILLITCGTEPDKGGINPSNITKLQTLFNSQSSVKVVIADYTTKAQFVIPDIANILDPKKYEVLDRDIAIGLSNILLGEGEKFANQNAKVEIFVEKLNHARTIFLNEFLIPEIKKISKELGFKNFPTPYYEKIDLKNELEYAKIYARLGELGILTPSETIEAIESGRLPSEETSIENQQKFKGLRDKDLYKPLLAKPTEGEGAGRPGGTTQKKKPGSKISPIGSSINYSLGKIKSNMILAQQLETKIASCLQTKHKLKELSEEQKEIAAQILNLVIANEEPQNWLEKTEEYISNPVDKNKERINELIEICAEHNLDYYMGGILLNSKLENKE